MIKPKRKEGIKIHTWSNLKRNQNYLKSLQYYTLDCPNTKETFHHLPVGPPSCSTVGHPFMKCFKGLVRTNICSTPSEPTCMRCTYLFPRLGSWVLTLPFVTGSWITLQADPVRKCSTMTSPPGRLGSQSFPKIVSSCWDSRRLACLSKLSLTCIGAPLRVSSLVALLPGVAWPLRLWKTVEHIISCHLSSVQSIYQTWKSHKNTATETMDCSHCCHLLDVAKCIHWSLPMNIQCISSKWCCYHVRKMLLFTMNHKAHCLCRHIPTPRLGIPDWLGVAYGGPSLMGDHVTHDSHQYEHSY